MGYVKKNVLSTLVLAAVVALVAGCGGPNHLLLETPQTIVQANKMVADGESMVAKGDKLVDEGESQQNRGEKMVEEGKILQSQGQELVDRGEQVNKSADLLEKAEKLRREGQGLQDVSLVPK